MRKFFMALAMLPLLSVVACNTPRDPASIGGAIGTIGGAVLTEFIPADLRDAVAGSCGFVITAADMTGITGQFPSLADAARAICAALKKPMNVRRRSGRTIEVNVNGALVRGQFVR